MQLHCKNNNYLILICYVLVLSFERFPVAYGRGKRSTFVFLVLIQRANSEVVNQTVRWSLRTCPRLEKKKTCTIITSTRQTRPLAASIAVANSVVVSSPYSTIYVLLWLCSLAALVNKRREKKRQPKASPLNSQPHAPSTCMSCSLNSKLTYHYMYYSTRVDSIFWFGSIPKPLSSL